MSQIGDDCYFFYYSSCHKGQSCPFRHVEEARGNEVECELWKQGRCLQNNCPYRHMELLKNRQAIPCYWETQPGGCTKPYCPFLHTHPKTSVPPPFTGPPPARPHISGPHPVPPQVLGPPPPSLQPIPGLPPPRPPDMSRPPPPHMWRAPGPPPPFHTFPPGPRPGPFVPEQGGVRMIMVPKVDPVIVNINSEDSDQDGSPMKSIRAIHPSIRKSQSESSLMHPEMPPGGRPEHNPLDYFLGAKPWIDPNPTPWGERRSMSPDERPVSPIRFQSRRSLSASPSRSRGPLSPARSRGSRSPAHSRGSQSPVRSRGSRSPVRRRGSQSPVRRRGSQSPVRRRGSQSPVRGRIRGSLSPLRNRRSPSPGWNRRRSISAERHGRPVDRRRSHSLDRSRSQSPDWKDRPRAPIRPRSRSPGMRRPLQGRHGYGPRRSPPRRPAGPFQLPQHRRERLPPPVKERPPVQELIIPRGPKIISTKKKEEEKKQEEESEKKEEEAKEDESGEVPLTEVRSLEDIYREKALRSLMEAKKKKVIENRRKKLEERAKQVKIEKPDLSVSEKAEEEKASHSDGEKSDQSRDKSDAEEDHSARSVEENESEEKSGESESQSSEEEEEANSEEEAEGTDEEAANEKAGSDVDLADDVDIELEAGVKDSDEGGSDQDQHTGSEEEKTRGSDEDERKQKRQKSSKPSIKSRLGVKSAGNRTRSEVVKRPETIKSNIKDRLNLNTGKPSIKDRLGKREEEPNVRSGVIKLNCVNPREAPRSLSEVRVNRVIREDNYGRHKDVLMVPKVVVRNRLDDFRPEYEHSRDSSRSRHGYDDYDDSEDDYDRDSEDEEEIIAKLVKRRKKVKRMLESEGSDFDEIELLKIEKKKIKKMLKEKKRRVEKREKKKKEARKRAKKKRESSEQDDDDDYDSHSDVEDERNRRRIKIQSRLGPAKQESERSEEDERKEELTEEVDLEEDVEIDLEEGIKEETEVEESKPTPQSGVGIKSLEQIRQEKADKLQKLQEALQPKTLDDIRRERAVKRGFESTESREKKILGGGRRIRLAEEEDLQPPPEQQVKITFNEDSKPPQRQKIRLKRDTEQNENRVPVAKTNKTFKRERMIYMPPALKTTDGPIYVDKSTEEAIKRATAGPADREIVDYADFFPSKKSKPATDVVTTNKPPVTAEPIRRLARGPPKVEVENAGIKSFAEIMAEKKRKRLLAQQESKKSITPIVFSSDQPDAGSVTSRLTPDLKSRLSPVEDTNSNDSTRFSRTTTQSGSFSPIKPSLMLRTTSSSSLGAKTTDSKTTNNGAMKLDTNLEPGSEKQSYVSNVIGFKRTIVPTSSINKEPSTQKPNRWKRRKPNTETNEDSNLSIASVESVTSESKSSGTVKSEVIPDTEKSEEQVSPVVSVKLRKWSISAEKKTTKMSDSLLDFEDELLGEVDLDLDDNKSHDELMREMEELLA